MKNKLYIMKCYLKTKTFLSMLLLTTVVSLSNILLFFITSNSNNIFKIYYGFLTNEWGIISILLLTAVVTKKFTTEIKNNTNYALRLGNRKNLSKHIFKVILVLNTIVLLVYYLLPLIMLFIFGKDLSITKMQNYKDLNLTYYLAFGIIKNIILINLMNFLYGSLNLISRKISIIYFLLVICTVLCKLKVLPSYYLISQAYSNFKIEIYHTLFYSVIFSVVVLFIYKLYLILKIDNVQ